MKPATALALILAAAALSACAKKNGKTTDAPPPAVGMANPASVFCVERGGKLEPRKDAEGNEYAMCHLPDGSVVEEWEYFRKHSK